MSPQVVDYSMSGRTLLSTSAAGPMRPSPAARILPLVRALYISGTAAAGALGAEDEDLLISTSQTNSGLRLDEGSTRDEAEAFEAPSEEPRATGSPIMELRRLTGFTWDQLARLFGVQRRSLHFWASGKPLNAANEEKLGRLLAAIRLIDRGSSSENRALLLHDHEGLIPFDLLVEERFDEVVAIVGSGPGRPRPARTQLSPEARAARRPGPPEELVGALQDRVHVEKGRLLAATPIKTNRDK